MSWLKRLLGGAADAGKGAAKTADDVVEGIADSGSVAAKRAGDATGVSTEVGEQISKRADELSKRVDDLSEGKAAKKAEKSSILSKNAGTLLSTGVIAGGIYYLDQKYKDAKEEVKDCMKVCLPANWDDYAYGDLDKQDLQYKELENVGEQPVCSSSMPDCGKYCGDKCEEIHDYDAPGSGLIGGLAKDAGETAGDVFSGLFGGLFEGLGIDDTTLAVSSGVSFICCCMLIILMILLR